MATIQEIEDALSNVDKALQASPNDPVLLKEANQLADAIAEMSGPRNAIESAQQFKEPYTISPEAIALGTLAGTVFGGGEAVLGKGALTAANAAWKAIKGGTSGVASTTAGEFVREATNNSPEGQMWAFGTELATGAVPTLTGDLITRTPLSGLIALGSTVTGGGGYSKARAAKTVAAGRSESDIAARNKLFGAENRKAGVATDVFTAQQEKLDADIVSSIGVQIAQAEKPVGALRKYFYTTFDNNSFKDSPEAKDMLIRLKQGPSQGFSKKEDFGTIVNLVNGQNSKDPLIAKGWNSKFLNTIQQAEPEWNGIKISDDASALLKESVDKFTQRVSGTPLYSTLKEMESNGYVATARDSIPVIINQGFTGELTDRAIENIGKSAVGKRDFRIALASYLKNLPEEEALSEFNRLYPKIAKLKTIDVGELATLKSQVSRFYNKTKLGKTKDITATALKSSIIRGVIPAELSSRFLQDENTALEPFNQ
jgi:hypothetical protein